MMKNKKGFMTIYLCLFFLTLASLICIFVYSTKQSTIQSGAETLSRLWGQSILAEYDLNLQKKYHLFGFYGYPADIKEKLKFYAESSFQQHISWEMTSCSLSDYSLRNMDIFRKQVVASGKIAETERFIRPEKNVIPVTDHDGGNVETLFHQLPSAGCKSNFVVSRMIETLKKNWTLGSLAESGSTRYFEIEYAFSHFKDAEYSRDLGASYFQNEIEYLICGKQSDEGNRKAVRNRIVAVREVLNLLYLQENKQMQAEALAVAEILTPGPAAVATQQALLSAWSLAESVNDYRLLVNHQKVPLKKSSFSWAVDLESAMENEAEGYILTGIEEGDTYEDYLRFFLYMAEEPLLLLRMMDLIQINMRWLYYDQFLLREYHGGICFVLDLNGREHEVKMSYE